MITEPVAQPSPPGFGRGRRTNLIGLLTTAAGGRLTFPAYLGPWAATNEFDPWTLHVISGVYATSQALGFGFVRCAPAPDETIEEFVTRMEGMADAVVVMVTRCDQPELLPALRAHHLPHAYAFGRGPFADVPTSACDNVGGVARAVRHLASLGHHRIAFLEPDLMHADHAGRREGYLQGLQEAGLPADPGLLATVDGRTSSTVAAASHLLRQADRPTAFVCANDLFASGAVDACWSLGLRVPHDVAIIGFDDLGEAVRIIPPLTTLRQPAREIAGYATYLAACAALGQPPATGWQVDLPVPLVVRDSCGARLAGRDASESDDSTQFMETRSAQPELEMRLRQLAATNQEMQDFLTVASHDLRAPLVTIDGFANSLERRYADVLDARGRNYVSGIRHSAAHLRYLTDTLLELSRVQSQPLRKTPVAVHQVVEDVIRDLDGLITQRQARPVIWNGLPTVLADEMALRQIFTNLLSNALKYLGDQPEPAVIIRYTRRESEHEFAVSDNGLGIAPEHQDEVFKLYRRLPGTEVEGTGIGLTMVKRWVLRHGGRIWVESELGRGATFRFTLPRSPVDEAAPAAD